MSKRSVRERRRAKRRAKGDRRMRLFRRLGGGCWLCGFSDFVGGDLKCSEHMS